MNLSEDAKGTHPRTRPEKNSKRLKLHLATDGTKPGQCRYRPNANMRIVMDVVL